MMCWTDSSVSTFGSSTLAQASIFEKGMSPAFAMHVPEHCWAKEIIYASTLAQASIFETGMSQAAAMHVPEHCWTMILTRRLSQS